jgi:hypothetical protein
MWGTKMLDKPFTKITMLIYNGVYCMEFLYNCKRIYYDSGLLNDKIIFICN